MALAPVTAFRPSEAQAAPEPRLAPHNIEAEQALLGAILVHPEAFDRVSDFLEPAHFFEELHRRIYEVTRQLMRAGKAATPVTLKAFLGEIDLGGITTSQYLARLAAEATTIVNAGEYGRAIYEMALRRDLILVGEEVAARAYDAPPDDSPRQQIEEAERKLYALAETGRERWAAVGSYNLTRTSRWLNRELLAFSTNDSLWRDLDLRWSDMIMNCTAELHR